MNNFFTSALRAVLDRLSGKADKENKAGGFAGGRDAKAVNSDMNDIDAVQLGTGTNSTEKTLQVYGYRLMNADGSVPDGRIPQLKGKLDCKISADGYTDGYIYDGLYYLDIEYEDYGLSGEPSEPFYLYVSRTDTTNLNGGWHMAQHRIKEGVMQRRYGTVSIVAPQPNVTVEPVEGETTEIEFFSDNGAATASENSSSITVSWGTWENYLTDADIEKLLDEYQTKLTLDSEPAEESANAITSGGVWKAISDLKNYVNDCIGVLNTTLENRLDGD